MTIKRLVLLWPSYAHYRIPVFEKLNKEVGDGFNVITLQNPMRSSIERLDPSEAGNFQRILIKGKSIGFGKFEQGLETPGRIIITPTLPYTLASLKPDVIISDTFSVWTLTSILMGYKTIVLWEGTTHTERTLKPWKKRIRQWMTKRLKAFITNGKLSKQYLIDVMNAPEDKIVMGGMCGGQPPAEIVAQIANRKIENDQPIRFVFSGQLIGRKGVTHLLQATAILKNKIGNQGNFEVLLLGDGSDRQELENQAQQLNITDKVTFAGYVNPNQIWEYYTKSHVFVLPTLHDNWPLVVPEAMSVGLPILLSKYAGSVPDLIKIDENGYIFDPNDHEELANLMAKYIENPSLIQKHGQHSLEIVVPYNPEKVAEVMMSATKIAMNLT